MAFYDASSLTTGLTEPQVRLTPNGRIYTGRHISVLRWLTYYAPKLSTLPDTYEAQLPFYREVITEMFQPKWYEVWNYGVVNKIIKHDQMMLMLQSFFQCQTAWINKTTQASPKTMSGNVSASGS